MASINEWATIRPVAGVGFPEARMANVRVADDLLGIQSERIGK
jgi:hypothetical protein